MSVVIEPNTSQIGSVISELTKVRTNITTGIRPAVARQMEYVKSVAVDETHFITHVLQEGWQVQENVSGTTYSITLFNPVSYAQEEFTRPGVKKSTGTLHNIMPQLLDLTNSTMEQTVFGAVTKDLR